MTQSDDHFDEFEPHTRLKHLILQTYLQAWARKLLLRQGAGDRVYYVDGCAGRGMDDAGNRGSPVVAAREAAMTEGQLRDRHNRIVRVQVIAIEKKRSTFNVLQENLRPFGEGARAVHGELATYLPILKEEMGDAPALFFIDPFGIEPLDASVIAFALQRPKTEVFLMFADQAALRHFGVVTAEEAELERERAAENGLFALTDSDRARMAAQREARTEARESTRESCEAIMNAAFAGDSWLRATRSVPRPHRRDALLRCYCEFLRSAGAAHVLPIPIRRETNTHVYHLIHATNSRHGYRAMKEAVETGLNKGPVGGRAVNTMRFLIRSDVEGISSLVRSEFAGKEVRWAEDRAAPMQFSLKRFVLENTPIFPSELPELQKRLGQAKQPGRTIVYRFPPLSAT